MTVEIAILLGVLVLALILFSFERLPADMIALGLLLFITITGLLPMDQAFDGFGSDAVMMILGLLILTASLVRTGVVDLVGRFLARLIGTRPRQLLLVIMLAASVMSSWISNTAATAFLIPVAIGIARRARISSSKLLMPLAFASILSSSVTLVATSTNIVVSSLMEQYNLPPLKMFELTPVGLPIALVGLVYLLVLGFYLIPDNKVDEEGIEDHSRLHYLADVVILPGSPLVGKTLEESGLGRDLDLTVLRVVRNRKRLMAPTADFRLEEGDLLLVKGEKEEILRIKDVVGLSLKADVSSREFNLQGGDVRLAEAVLLFGSPMIGRTLKGLQFRERYGLQVLAVNRHGETIESKLAAVRFQVGDVLLLQGPKATITSLAEERMFRVIGSLDTRLPKTRRAPLAVGAFVLALGLASFDILRPSIAVMLGVLVVFIGRAITPEEAYREVEWKALILIACMLGVGSAMESTGAARYLANLVVSWFGRADPIWLLSGFFVLTMLLTQPMSNQAAAAVVLPLAVQTALQLGLNPRTFAVMIAVGASCSFLTPLEPACLMVYGIGRYKFIDFLKVGAPLTLLVYLVAIWLVPWFWPIR